MFVTQLQTRKLSTLESGLNVIHFWKNMEKMALIDVKINLNSDVKILKGATSIPLE